MQAGRITVERDLMVPARDGVMLATDSIGRTGPGRSRYCSNARPTTNRRRAAPSAPPPTRRRARATRSPPISSRTATRSPIRTAAAAIARAAVSRNTSARPRTAPTRSPGSMRQPWCDGRIGTFGLSYAAHTQAALACLDPPGLAAQFLDCGGFSNAYRSGIRHGGAFDLKQATWAYRNALADARDPETRAALRGAGHRRVVPPDAVDARGIRRSAPPPNTRTICSSSGRTAPSTITGSSPASRPRGSTTATPRSRSCICRAGTTRTRAPRWRTMSA